MDEHSDLGVKANSYVPSALLIVGELKRVLFDMPGLRANCADIGVSGTKGCNIGDCGMMNAPCVPPLKGATDRCVVRR